MAKVTFIADFATKKKGELFVCDSLLASQLVHNDKVAIYFTVEQKKEAVAEKEKPKKISK